MADQQPRFKNEYEFAKWWDEVQKDPTNLALVPEFQSSDVRLMTDLATRAGCRVAMYFQWANVTSSEKNLLVPQARHMGLLAPKA